MLGMLTMCGLYEYYSRTCPEIADQQTGHISALNDHGHVVYLTVTEERTMNDLPLLFCVVGFFLAQGSTAPNTKSDSAGNSQG
jgi:hypothetical protein